MVDALRTEPAVDRQRLRASWLDSSSLYRPCSSSSSVANLTVSDCSAVSPLQVAVSSSKRRGPGGGRGWLNPHAASARCADVAGRIGSAGGAAVIGARGLERAVVAGIGVKAIRVAGGGSIGLTGLWLFRPSAKDRTDSSMPSVRTREPLSYGLATIAEDRHSRGKDN
eukprot:scaffold1558_cov403-Prasinococcus_capsulatus_cf.AAC.21